MSTFEKKIWKAFKAMDTDGSGFLELDELENALKSVGGFTESEVKTIAKKMLEEDDENGDGKISFEEFLHGVQKESKKNKGKKK